MPGANDRRPIPARLARLRHVALDMDGTIYSGSRLFEETRPFLALLAELGIGYTFLTNNSSKSARDYQSHLAKMGIRLKADQLYISTHSAIEYLRRHRPAARRLFVLGTASMRDELRLAGFKVVTEPTGPSTPRLAQKLSEPDAVVAGFDTGLTFDRLCCAAYWIEKGKPFVATHPDRVCPTDKPTVLVDCGSICAALEAATGRRPDKVLGKPDPRMLRGVQHRHSLAADELAMVGDRLYTDMAMAHRAGALAVLVLTGETTRRDAARHHPQPDLVVEALDEFGERLRRARSLRKPTGR